MKTVKEWLETIADENVRNRAISLTEAHHAPTLSVGIAVDLHNALSMSFVWADTEEGHDFWRNIAYHNKTTS